jgi:hypothetical protein
MTLELKTRRQLELTSQREKVSLFVFVQHFLEQVIYVENLFFKAFIIDAKRNYVLLQI